MNCIEVLVLRNHVMINFIQGINDKYHDLTYPFFLPLFASVKHFQHSIHLLFMLCHSTVCI